MSDLPDGSQDWHGRLAPLDEDDPTEEQAAMAADIRRANVEWAQRSGFAATDSAGRLIGPFNALATRPTYGRAFNRWVGTDQRDSTLPARVREVVILTVGVAWDSDYEVYAHVAVARSVGLSEAAIAAIRAHEADDSLDADELAAHRYVDELVRTHRVAQPTYDAALAAFGRDGVLDMTQLTGMYLATSALLNALEVPAPPIPDEPPAQPGS